LGIWRVGLFRVLRGVARGLEVGARASLCLAAGLLHRDQLAAAIADRWQDFGATEAAVLSGLMPWEREFYARFLTPDDEILVVGCGTGRDLIALRRAGYKVEGLEAAPRAAALARAMLVRQGLSAPIAVGRIEATPIPRAFDVYIFSWFCYSYIPTRATRVSVLQAVARRLTPGGRILITYVPSEGQPGRRAVALTRLVTRVARADWRPEEADAIALSGGGLHFEHQFGRDEIESEAAAARLRVVFHQHGDNGTLVLAGDASPLTS
jgi:SAM-dependent methyltransferase